MSFIIFTEIKSAAFSCNRDCAFQVDNVFQFLPQSSAKMKSYAFSKLCFDESN